MVTPLEYVYTNFHSKLLRFIAGRVPDRDSAEDILQDVFLKIHQHIGDLRESDRLESWIYQITRNAIIDYYRRSRPQQELSEAFALHPEDEPDAIAELSPSVAEMLDCLPSKYRQALELTDLQGLTQIELAARLNLSVSGAKSRVQRAREKLRNCLLDCCHFEFDRLGQVVDYHPRCDQCTDKL